MKDWAPEELRSLSMDVDSLETTGTEEVNRSMTIRDGATFQKRYFGEQIFLF